MTEGLTALAIVAWLAYIASRVLATRQVPELVGFLAVGAALGPSGFKVLEASQLASLRPVTEIALAILMFIIGERVSRPALKAARWAVTAGIAQYILSGTAVYFASQWAGADQVVSLLLATLAGAGAPLTVSAVVSSKRAKGKYVGGLVSTHALCDALAATVFAAVLPVAQLMADSDTEVSDAILNFVRLGIGGVVLGVVFGLLIARLGFQIESSGELLLFVLVHMLLGWVVADWAEVSLPLGALVAGSVAASITEKDFSQRLFRTMRTIEQPLYLMFFALAGASIHLAEIPSVGLVGVAYMAARVLGKMSGGFIGGLTGGLKWRTSIRLGIDSTPQAGVAVGLAVLASEELPLLGGDAATIILGSVVVFELIGPLLLARGLAKSPHEEAIEGRPPDFDSSPQRILFASHFSLSPPAWLLSDCHRWEAELDLLLPNTEDDPDNQSVRDHVAEAELDLCLHPYVRGESFTGAVVRLATELRSDLVVIVETKGTRPPGSRLVLLPHERIVRQLGCPVVIYQMPADESIEQ